MWTNVLPLNIMKSKSSEGKGIKTFEENMWNKHQIYFFERLLDKKGLNKRVTCLLRVSGKYPDLSQRLILQNICDSICKPILLSEPICYFEEMEKVNTKTFSKLIKHYIEL